ncbi:MAG: putative ketoacyl reductase [Planctomycetes bacterium]|nr:putative ketoacyl reductase [Planctomycetota bacterium]HRJ78070.1 SDR family oxidoreductase [Planctomycetota bacterium]
MESPWIIVTGASRGIGLAVARELLRDAAFRVVAVARDEAALKAAFGGSAGVQVVVQDVTDAGAGERLAELCPAAWGLVNNAGLAESAPLKQTDDDLLRRHMELNFYAPMRLTRALVAKGVRRVVNLCSTAALTGYPYVSAYAASKHALLGATRSLAREFAAKGVTFNAVCPGYVRTEMFERTLENIAAKTGLDRAGAESKLAQLSPQGRVFEPGEVAALVRYLLGPQAAGINGQALSIDGGEVAH